jgi:hypothetical protein
MAKHSTVDSYIAALPKPLAEVASAACSVIEREFGEGAIRWAHPTWSVGKEPVCYLKAASAHVTFGFWRGASIEDPSGRLRTSGTVMAHAKLRTPADIEPELFEQWLRQARALAGG